MSVRLMTAVWDLPTASPTQKLVLLALADSVNEKSKELVCWPSISTIAKKCALSERAVRDQLRQLEALKLVSVIKRQRPNGSHSSNFYEIHLPKPIMGGGKRGAGYGKRGAEGVVNVVPPLNQNIESEENQKLRYERARPLKPNLSDIVVYGGSIDLEPNCCEAFFDYWESYGWHNGQRAIMDWRSALKTWKRREVT